MSRCRTPERACLSLCCSAVLLGGCAGLPRYAEPVSGTTAPSPVVEHCKNQADDAANASSIDALPPDPPAKNALGAFFGNAVGKSVVLRRSYGRCMEEAGYVRLG